MTQTAKKRVNYYKKEIISCLLIYSPHHTINIDIKFTTLNITQLQNSTTYIGLDLLCIFTSYM